MEVMHAGFEDVTDMVGPLQAAEDAARYAAMPPAKLAQLLRKLEQEMLAAAENLEFELGAAKRDEIRRVKEQALIAAA